MSQQPSVGRIVHYVSYGTPPRADGAQAYTSECRAAIVTEVLGDHPHDELGPRVGLCVLNPTGQFFNRNVAFHDGDPDHVDVPTRLCTTREHAGGTWHWPERR